MLFSNQALELNPIRVKALIQNCMKAIAWVPITFSSACRVRIMSLMAAFDRKLSLIIVPQSSRSSCKMYDSPKTMSLLGFTAGHSAVYSGFERGQEKSAGVF